jgi:L-aminopeptidase/D-esterase-like protein
VTDQQRGSPRARALGVPLGGTPGQWNAITDVPGVEVGYQTIIRGGNGELTGAAWIQESGTTSLPIALTSTHAVGIAHAGIIAVPWDAIDPFFTAVVQGTEEAVANALCAGEEMTGYRGHRVPGLPRDRVAALFGKD